MSTIKNNLSKLIALVLLTATLTVAPAAIAGSIDGPAEGVERVRAFQTDVYEFVFAGGFVTEIVVIGDGDTDLDLFVYDENDNLIASDRDGTDTCYVSLIPRWTGSFRVEVRNLGSVYNEYTIMVN